jgi:hypothetical protein
MSFTDTTTSYQIVAFPSTLCFCAHSLTSLYLQCGKRTIVRACYRLLYVCFHVSSACDLSLLGRPRKHRKFIFSSHPGKQLRTIASHARLDVVYSALSIDMKEEAVIPPSICLFKCCAPQRFTMHPDQLTSELTIAATQSPVDGSSLFLRGSVQLERLSPCTCA